MLCSAAAVSIHLCFSSCPSHPPGKLPRRCSSLSVGCCPLPPHLTSHYGQVQPAEHGSSFPRPRPSSPTSDPSHAWVSVHAVIMRAGHIFLSSWINPSAPVPTGGLKCVGQTLFSSSAWLQIISVLGWSLKTASLSLQTGVGRRGFTAVTAQNTDCIPV